MISILRIGSLRSPPPFRLRLWTHLRREGSKGAVPHSDCPTACGGKVVAPATKGGNAGVVHEVYDSLFFSLYLSFPLEGKSREAGKGVRGRAPIGCSIAVLTANRRPPREKVLKIDRPFRAQGFLSLTQPSAARVVVSPYRAMSIIMPPFGGQVHIECHNHSYHRPHRLRWMASHWIRGSLLSPMNPVRLHTLRHFVALFP